MATERNDAAFAVKGMRLERGTHERSSMRLAELPDGSWLDIPFSILRGAQPGPILYLGASFHGDEVAGVEVVARLASTLEPSKVRGTIVFVPVQNPLAFQIQHRFFIGHMLKSPMDQNPADPWASFPGDPDGNLAAIIAHGLFDRLMRHAHYMIDIHTPTTGGRYAPFAFLPPTRCGDVVNEAERLARAFGADFILANDKGMYVGDKNPHTILAERGVPAFGIEFCEGARNDEEDVAFAVRGVRNVLKAVGMIDGVPEKIGKQMVMRTMAVVRAKRAGLLHLKVGLHDDVRLWQTVATVVNPFGEVIEEIKSPTAGPVVRVATFGVVSTGERVIQLAVPR